MTFDRILMLSNLGVEMGLPNFRMGAYKIFLLPMASNILNNSSIDVRVLANKHIHQQLYPTLSNWEIDSSRLIEFQDAPIRHIQNFMTDSYHEIICEKDKELIQQAICDSLGSWEPQIIISWEAPSTIWRELFPDALVLDFMPGMFMRPPFPRMVSIDPVGLYKDCWFQKENIESFTVSDEVKDNFHRIKSAYATHLLSFDMWTLFERRSLDNAILAPLQISDYFSWFANCDFDNQFDYMIHMLTKVENSSDIIFTQYISGPISERVINSDNISNLTSDFNNFIYNDSFNKINNCSQYLIPHMNSVCSVSSTLGLQAKFFGKKLISPSHSHLSYLADTMSIEEAVSCKNRNLDNFMATFLGRTQFLQNRLNNDFQYLISVLEEFYERKNHTGVELFPSFEQVDNNFKSMIGSSALPTSTKLIQKVVPKKKLTEAEQRMEKCQNLMESDQADYVSFDVFDTLLCRTVMRPDDIFYLMKQHLFETHLDRIDSHFINLFPLYRKEVELLLRRHAESSPESAREISILDVYHEILRRWGLDISLADEMIDIEQEIELQCLKPRPTGEILYNHAIALNKQIIIISDFIHPEAFVETALKQNGFSHWSRLFVSSKIGVKKHSGRMFDYVKEELQTNNILHFGDNPHGDIEMARQYDLSTSYLQSGPSIIQELLHSRKFALIPLKQSLVTRTILSVYSNQFLQIGGSRQQSNKPTELISNAYEFGFLVLGPIMHAYSKWIVEECKKTKIKQVLFFARDSKLPYEMVKSILEKQNIKNINLIYLPVSRISVTGLDITEPSDVFSVRVDDFSKHQPLVKLLECRFFLKSNEISQEELAHWNESENVEDILVKDIPETAIYEIAYKSYKANWKNICKRVKRKRETFNVLLQKYNVDPDKKTIAVDLGYKGTIQKKIQPYFKYPLCPRFFMGYSDGYGYPPMDGLQAFYSDNLVPSYKDNFSFLKYNLMFETLLNEGIPSVKDYQLCNQGDDVKVIYGTKLSNTHINTIKEIHKGAIRFSYYWLDNCAIIDRYAQWENSLISYIFDHIFRFPSEEEATLLSPLTFDNGYACTEVRYFIGKKKGSDQEESSGLWREGHQVLNRSLTKKLQQTISGLYKR